MYVSHAHIRSWEAHECAYRRLSSVVMRVVPQKFVYDQLLDVGW